MQMSSVGQASNTDKQPSITSPTSSSSVVSALRQRVHGYVFDQSVVNDLRKSVLSGAINATTVKTFWAQPSWRLMIYVSSAMVDSVQEREIIKNELFAATRRVGYKSGISVEFIDLQPSLGSNDWELKSWIHRRQIISRCRDQSIGLCFLSLLSNKYGATILPLRVTVADYDRITANCSEMDKLLLSEYYCLDENAIPPDYAIKMFPLNTNFVAKILRLLDNTQADPTYCDELETGKSVQEWELKSVFAHMQDKSRMYWLHRSLTEESRAEPNFDEFFDEGATRDRLEVLQRWMQRKFEALTALHLPTISHHSYVNPGATFELYKDSFKSGIGELMNNTISSIAVQRRAWEKDSFWMGIPGEDAAEMLFHCSRLFDISKDFVGRDDFVKDALEQILKSRDTVEADTLRTLGVEMGPLDHIALAIVGTAGTGKSYMMAKLAELVFEKVQADTIVITRFCGETAHSSTGLGLMHSICSQIHFVLKLPHNKDLYGSSYEDTVIHFHSLMANYCIILFLDGLDHMLDENFSRSQLNFLRGIILNPKSRIVLSTRPDQHDLYSNKWIAFYGCDSKLLEDHVNRVHIRRFDVASEYVNDTVYADEQDFEMADPIAAPAAGGEGTVELDFEFHVNLEAVGVPLDNAAPIAPTIVREEASEIVDAILRKRGRCLQASQKRELLKACAQDPRIITIKLLCILCSEWTSSVLPSLPVGGLPSIVFYVLEELDSLYTSTIVTSVCGYLALSLRGISDNEMIDLLSLEPAVMMKVNTITNRRDHRFPSFVWYHLRENLAKLTVELDGCLMFANQCIAEAVIDSRLETVTDIHRRMALYFGDLLTQETRTRTGAISQPLLLNKNIQSSVWTHSPIINKRRCQEAAHHMLRCEMYSQAMVELCDLESVCARAKCGLGFFYLSQLVQLSSLFQNPRVVHYIRWLGPNMSKITRNPALNIVMTCTEQPMISTPRKDLTLLMHSFSQLGKFCESNWVRCVQVGGRDDFGAHINTLAGHSNRISATAWSPDGTMLLSSGWDKSICLWGPHIGTLRHRFDGHSAAVTGVSWCPDSKFFASVSWDNTMAIWDVESGQVVHICDDHTDFVCTVAWSPNKKYIATGSYDTSVRIWNASTGTVHKVLEGHSNWVSSLSWSPDSMLLASGSNDRTIMLWYVSFGAWKQTLKGHLGAITSIAWSKDGVHLASGAMDKSVFVWDVHNKPDPIRTLSLENAVTNVCWNDSNKTLAIAASDGNVRIWSFLTNKVLGVHALHADAISAMCWSPDSAMLVTGLLDGRVHTWDAAILSRPETVNLHRDGVLEVAWSLDGRFIATSSKDTSILVWDAQTCKYFSKLQYHKYSIVALCWSPDGKYIVSSGEDHKAVIWDVASGIPFKVESYPDKQYCTSVAWCRGEGIFAFGNSDGTVHIKVALTLEEKRCIHLHTTYVSSVAFNVKRVEQLASCSRDNTVTVSNWTNGLIICRFEAHRNWVTRVLWNPNGIFLGSVSLDRTMRVWSISAQEEIVAYRFEASYPINSAAWNSDGVRVVLGFTNGSICVWNSEIRAIKAEPHDVSDENPESTKSAEIEEEEEEFHLHGHDNEVTSVDWSPDGMRVVSVSLDNSVRLWDAVRSAEVVSRENELLNF